MFEYQDENPVSAYVIANFGNKVYYMTGDIAAELGTEGAVISPEEGGPMFYRISEPFAWKLMMYYWILSRFHMVDFHAADKFLNSGHDPVVEDLVYEQIDMLNRKFYELSQIPSDNDLREYRRRALAWFYDNLAYSADDDSSSPPSN